MSSEVLGSGGVISLSSKDIKATFLMLKSSLPEISHPLPS
jgi:hypothetical protein